MTEETTETVEFVETAEAAGVVPLTLEEKVSAIVAVMKANGLSLPEGLEE